MIYTHRHYTACPCNPEGTDKWITRIKRVMTGKGFAVNDALAGD